MAFVRHNIVSDQDNFRRLFSENKHFDNFFELPKCK